MTRPVTRRLRSRQEHSLDGAGALAFVGREIGKTLILVLASKNDAAPVDDALRRHPEMLLRPEAFAVRAVNWSAKAENLRQAAGTLNLGSQSFLDRRSRGNQTERPKQCNPRRLVTGSDHGRHLVDEAIGRE